MRFTPLGLVDHTVHVLRVDGSNGSPVAIVFGYACHNTRCRRRSCAITAIMRASHRHSWNQRHPGAAALFVAGCGADANRPGVAVWFEGRAQRRMWTAGYSNDVFAYVPSLRVLKEGGYEGGDAMIYYGRPGPFAGNVEDLIIGGVRGLLEGR